MNILEYTTVWVKGEIAQGKIMILLGVLFLIICFLIWKIAILIRTGRPLYPLADDLMGFSSPQFAGANNKTNGGKHARTTYSLYKMENSSGRCRAVT